jgi:UDP-N-acetylmuramate dehydrogenase
MNMAEVQHLQNLRGELRLNEPMAKHVSWRAGGAAARTYAPVDLDDLVAFLRTVPLTEDLYFVGLGSNLLVRDGGLKATVVFTHWALRQITLLNTGERDIEFHAGAGIASPKAARFAALHGAQGAEFLAGIPGTLGGALAMNAGCYGGETWELVSSVTAIDRAGQLHQRGRDEYQIAYRSVKSISGPADEWFVSATLRVPKGDGEKSRNKIKALLSKRIASQPLQQPNAGSVFRNPVDDHAARLIEACGLKGTRIGGAEISRKHSNFIVNTGGPGVTKAADIEALIDLAQNTVREKFGVELEREVRIVGERT